MSGRIPDLPSDIVAAIIVNRGWGSSGDLSPLQSWPVFVEDEQNDPDNCITVYTVGSNGSGRVMQGETIEQQTFQVRVRSQNPSDGWSKLNEIADGFDKQVYYMSITIGGNNYLVHSINRRGGIISLGKEYPESLRSLFTLNAQISVRLVS